MAKLPKGCLFLDLDNIWNLLKTAGITFDPELIMEIVRHQAQILCAEGFIDVNRSRIVYEDKLFLQSISRASVDLIHVPKIFAGMERVDVASEEGEHTERQEIWKDRVDAAMERRIRWIAENVEQIEVFILGTVDSDFSTLIADLRNRGKQVYLLFPSSFDYINGYQAIKRAANGVIEITNRSDYAIEMIRNSVFNPNRNVTEIAPLLQSWRLRGLGYVVNMVFDIFTAIQILYWEVDLGNAEWCSFNSLEAKIFQKYFVKKGHYSRHDVRDILTLMNSQDIFLSQTRENGEQTATEYILNEKHPFVKLALKKSWDEIYS